MSTAARRKRDSAGKGIPTLVNGDHMNQADFHRSYLAYPDDTKFELIAGTVYMASPLGSSHSIFHFLLGGLLFAYVAETPGVKGHDNITFVLDDEK